MTYNQTVMCNILQANNLLNDFFNIWLSEIENIRVDYQIRRSINGMASALLLNPQLVKPIIFLANRSKDMSNDSEIDDDDEEWDEFEYMKVISPVVKQDNFEFLKEMLSRIPQHQYEQMLNSLTQQEYDTLNKILYI
jgi:hypothetical protein